MYIECVTKSAFQPRYIYSYVPMYSYTRRYYKFDKYLLVFVRTTNDFWFRLQK